MSSEASFFMQLIAHVADNHFPFIYVTSSVRFLLPTTEIEEEQ